MLADTGAMIGQLGGIFCMKSFFQTYGDNRIKPIVLIGKIVWSLGF